MEILPKTKLGKWSVWLLAAAVVLLVVGIVVVTVFHQTGGNTIFDNLYISVPMIGAGVAIETALITGIISVWKYKERSLLIAAPIAIGLMVTVFLIGEFTIPH